MPLFRVYLRRPGAQFPVWDWAQTVSATTAASALNHGYENWVESNPDPAAPPLAQCQSQVRPVTMSVAYQ